MGQNVTKLVAAWTVNPRMRIAFSLLVVFLLALSALAAGGCGRVAEESGGFHLARASHTPSFGLPVMQVPSPRLIVRQVTAPRLFHCDCSLVQRHQAGVSAVAAQVKADMEPNNDDPSDLISFERVEQPLPAAPRELVALGRLGQRGEAQRPLLRPPRPVLA